MPSTAACLGVSKRPGADGARIQCELPGSGTRIFAVSDLHVDFPANMLLVESVDTRFHQHDVLIVAGDVSAEPQRIETARSSSAVWVVPLLSWYVTPEKGFNGLKSTPLNQI